MNVLKAPIVTEKMTMLTEKLGSYGFLVQKSANKVQIKQAIEQMYGVKVESVNTMRTLGKFKSRFTKAGAISGRESSVKKAVVTLAKGEVIDFYSNI